ncbi:MAG: hypothetical protein ACK4NW_09850 [Roseinatronobacter sp.]
MKKAFILALLAMPVQAQNFTTQAEVQPILEMTRANWVGIGTAMGQDLLYFSHVLSWRCGLSEIRYAVNGGALQVLEMEPCYHEITSPNSIRELPFVAHPLNSLESVIVELEFPDGQVISETYPRSAIRID